jgi:hypothetical protein
VFCRPQCSIRSPRRRGPVRVRRNRTTPLQATPPQPSPPRRRGSSPSATESNGAASGDNRPAVTPAKAGSRPSATVTNYAPAQGCFLCVESCARVGAAGSGRAQDWTPAFAGRRLGEVNDRPRCNAHEVLSSEPPTSVHRADAARPTSCNVQEVVGSEPAAMLQHARGRWFRTSRHVATCQRSPVPNLRPCRQLHEVLSSAGEAGQRDQQIDHREAGAEDDEG